VNALYSSGLQPGGCENILRNHSNTEAALIPALMKIRPRIEVLACQTRRPVISLTVDGTSDLSLNCVELLEENTQVEILSRGVGETGISCNISERIR
jgi:hypothetical protein